MVQKRQSLRSKVREPTQQSPKVLSSQENDDSENPMGELDAKVDALESSKSTTSSMLNRNTGSIRARTREIKKKQGADLRSKNFGLVVGKISTELTPSTKNKIALEDTSEEPGKLLKDKHQAESTSPNQQPKTTVFVNNVVNEIDPKEELVNEMDDNVEEVTGSLAKELVRQQKRQERETSLIQSNISSKRTRKWATELSSSANDLTTMDSDFFATLDKDLSEQTKEKTRAKMKPAGKITLFTSKDQQSDIVMEREHNIEVAVLGSHLSTSMVMGTRPSKAAFVFSRSSLKNGISTIKKTGVSQKKPLKKEGWVRSQKMSRLLLTGRKQRRSQPATHFVFETNPRERGNV